MASLYERVQKTAPNRLNPEQRKTWDTLVDAGYNPELCVIPTEDGAYAFECESGEFGVQLVGYIEPDGHVSWLG